MSFASTGKRLLVVGTGNIALRHARNLRLLLPDSTIAMVRRTDSCSDEAALREVVDEIYSSMAEAVRWEPWAAVVANPSSSHVEAATMLARQGVHILVEKPLSVDMEGVDDLLRLARERDLVLMVGYTLRFHQSLEALRHSLLNGDIGVPQSIRAEVGQYLPDWRGGADYRVGVTGQAKLGGGVVLELSHEIDYVRWLLGEIEAVFAQLARLSDLDIDVEDTAEIVLRFRSGALGSVHLDMTQQCPTRRCMVVGSAGTLSWDALTHQVRRYARHRGWTDLVPAAEIDGNVPYLREIEHFLDAAARRVAPSVTGEDGARVLEICLAIRRSAAEGRLVQL